MMHKSAVCTVIAGATRESQIDDNLNAVGLDLSEDVMQELNDASEQFIFVRPFGSGGRRR
jgi:aryl-alcohol dehydrogenase-like predicted oxidoreductase